MSTHRTKQSRRWLIGMASSLQMACSEWAGVSSMAIALVVMTSTVAAAGQLTQWQYNEASHQIELTLSEETTPRYFLLAQPARIVVDLPNTQVGAVPLEQSLSGPVRSVRINQFQPDVVRVVIELSSDAVLGDGQVAIQRVNTSDLSVRPLFAGELSEPAPMAIAPSSSIESSEPPIESAQEPANVAPNAAPAVGPSLDESTSAPLEAEADTLPPLEPGAIELTVTPPNSVPDDAEAGAGLAVPSVETALAELGMTGAEINPLQDEAIAEVQESDPGITITEATTGPIEHQFDPNAPVLDATVPTERNPAVLDATRPSSVMLMPPQASATSPQAALTQINEAIPEAAVEIPVEGPTESVEQPTPPPAENVAEAEPEPTPAVEPPDVEPEVAIAPAVVAPSSSTEETALQEMEVGRSPIPAPPSVASPTVESQRPAIAFGQPIVDQAETSNSIRSGTTVSLRYPGEAPLALNPGIRQEVLLLQQPIEDEQGNVIVEAGSPVIGRFETSETGSKFVVQAIASQAQNIRVTGESLLIGQEDSSSTAADEAAPSATFNPAALFSGVASSTATQIQPGQIVIQPDQIITVHLTDDLASR